MSRSYRVRIPIEILIPSSLREKEWKFNISFSLLDILPKTQMLALLSDELKKVGFEEQDNILVKELSQTSSIAFDLETVSATVHIENINVGDGITISVEEEVLASVKRQINAAIKNQTVMESNQAASLQDKLKGAAIKAMTVAATQAKVIVNSALKNVYREAIKEKAQKIANVTSITETSEDGTFRIRVEMEA